MKESDNLIKRFRQWYHIFSSIIFETLYWGTSGDQSIKGDLEPDILFINDKIKKSKDVVLSLSELQTTQLDEFLESYVTYISQIKDYSRSQMDTERPNIIFRLNAFKEQVIKIWSEIAGIYSEYILSQNTNNLKEQLETVFREANESNIQLKQEVTTFKEQYNELFQGSQAEILKQQIDFEKTSMENKNDSKTWILISCLFGAALIVICMCFLFSPWIDSGEFDFIQKSKIVHADLIFLFEIVRKSVLRLFIISIIIFGIKVCIANYNALKHNSIINRHKANCFNAANRMISIMPDKSIVEIANYASREIFSQQKTGYLLKDKNEINLTSLAKIIEILSKDKSK